MHSSTAQVVIDVADESKALGDDAVDQQDWEKAVALFTKGLDALKKSVDRSGDMFVNRAALLLSRRASANLKLQLLKPAMRDAVAALELAPSLTSAEIVAVEAAKGLGCKSDADVAKVLEQVGSGRILDPEVLGRAIISCGSGERAVCCGQINWCLFALAVLLLKVYDHKEGSLRKGGAREESAQLSLDMVGREHKFVLRRLIALSSLRVRVCPNAVQPRLRRTSCHMPKH